MNKELILNIITPYLNNNVLTYRMFDELFSMLSQREQYEIINLLIDLDIELADDDSLIEVKDISNLYGTAIQDEIKMVSNENDIYFNDSDNIAQTNENLCLMIQKGDKKAKNDLIIKNRNLVLKYANQYKSYFGHRLSISDLEMSGYIGLMSAALKFNTLYDTRFTTYAVYWIQQSILREIMDNGFEVRIPVHKFEEIAKATTLNNQLIQFETDEDKRMMLIAEKMEMKVENVLELFKLRKLYLHYVSINSPVKEDGDTELQELICDIEQKLPNEIANDIFLKEEVEKSLHTLTEREEKVIKLRFGILDGRERTLEEIGKEFNVTRERIRQIEAKALRKLRHPSRSKELREFIKDSEDN